MGQGKEYLNALAKRTFTGRMAPLGKVNYDAYALAAGIEGSFQSGAYLLTADHHTWEGLAYSFIRGSATGLVSRGLGDLDFGLGQRALANAALQMGGTYMDQAVLGDGHSTTELIASGLLGFSDPLFPASWFSYSRRFSVDPALNKQSLLYPLEVFGPEWARNL